MAAGFDPYHRWLSIPPLEQPPNHYRLLGLQDFESSFEVIENAAARQSRHVRGHLESPLRPYATNLLREIEIARLCLLDREAKSAYDACLKQRQEYRAPSDHSILPPRAHESTPHSSPVGSISFSAAPIPSIDTYRNHRRKRRKAAPLAFFLLWTAGGAMGLLAGYAILCMIDPQYDFLHVMFGKERPQQPEITITPLPPTARTPESSPRPRSDRSPQNRSRRTPSSPADQGGVADLEQPLSAGDPRGSAPKAQVPGGGGFHKNEQKAVHDLKPVVLPFDFKKRVLRVVSMPDVESYESLRCNIEASADLGMNQLIDFPLGGKQDIVFNSGLGGVIAGIEVSFLRRNKAVIVEITPKYRLPSGDEEAWYKTAGIRKAKLLSNQVSVATSARDALPGFRRELERVIAEIDSISKIVNSPTTPSGYARQLTASKRLQELGVQRNALQKQIRGAELLSKNLPILEVDLAAVLRLGEWSGGIAESATLAVCIHCDGVALDAEAR